MDAKVLAHWLDDYLLKKLRCALILTYKSNWDNHERSRSLKGKFNVPHGFLEMRGTHPMQGHEKKL